MTCNVMRAVTSAYKTLKINKRLPKEGSLPVIVIGERSAVHFDKRTYSLRGDTISLYTLASRIEVSMTLGDFQRDYLESGVPKEPKLVRKTQGWFFNLVVDMPPEALRTGGVLGVDLGENNIATTHTGTVFGGDTLRYDRDRFLALRKRLQRNGSQSAKQLLKRVSGRERRHVTQVNHEVSKALIAEAIDSGAGIIALERLTTSASGSRRVSECVLVCTAGRGRSSRLLSATRLKRPASRLYTSTWRIPRRPVMPVDRSPPAIGIPFVVRVETGRTQTSTRR